MCVCVSGLVRACARTHVCVKRERDFTARKYKRHKYRDREQDREREREQERDRERERER